MAMKRYYKGLDENLRAFNGLQYEIGKEYTAETDDKLHWIHFAGKMRAAIMYGTRIVEVEPVTAVQRYGTDADMNAETVRIIRELSHEEIVAKLMEEKCPINRMEDFQPSYEVLHRNRDRIHRRDHLAICNRFNWLTEEQKLSLLPKSWKMRVHNRELSRILDAGDSVNKAVAVNQ